MTNWADHNGADAFLAVVGLPGFEDGADSARTLGRVRARLEWRYGTATGAWRKRYIAPPKGGAMAVPFDTWETTVVEDTQPDWKGWRARHEAWTDGTTLAWFGRQGLGDRLDHWTTGIPVAYLALHSHKPTLVVATTLPVGAAHGKLTALERCGHIAAHVLPDHDRHHTFHLLWA
jgi:hypothetical protein